MEYTKKSFSVSVGSKNYRDNFDSIFKQPTEKKESTDESDSEAVDSRDAGESTRDT